MVLTRGNEDGNLRAGRTGGFLRNGSYSIALTATLPAGGGLHQKMSSMYEVASSISTVPGTVSIGADGGAEYSPRPFAKKYVPAPA